MKIILTSDGMKTQEIRDTVLGSLPVSPEKATALMIAYTEPSDMLYLEQAIDEVRGLGIQNLTVHNMYTDTNLDTAKHYDFLYMCGGNTFTILEHIRRQGIVEYLISLVKNGAVYFGVSAGSIIAGPTIEISSVGRDGGDPNTVRVTDFRAFGLTDAIISPHYSDAEEECVVEFEKQRGVRVSRLRDGEYLVI